MKKLFLIMVTTTILISCGSEPVGNTNQSLSGDEQSLPDGLKGLKIYDVKTNDGWVKVGIKDDVMSLNYDVQVGKIATTKTVILVNKKTNRLIEVEEILMENDSMIVCKRKTK